MRTICAILSGITLLYMLVAPPVFAGSHDADEIWIFAGFGIFMGMVAGWLYLLARGLDAREFAEGVSRRPFIKFAVCWGMRSSYLLGAAILLLVSVYFMISLTIGSYMMIEIAGMRDFGGSIVRHDVYGILHAVLMAPLTALSAICLGWFALPGRVTPRRQIA